jgi:hypothetical protein
MSHPHESTAPSRCGCFQKDDSVLQPGIEAARGVQRLFLPFVATLWLGLLLGVSFLATPVKFEAASLALPVALEVGRVTFALLAKVEWLFSAAIVVAVLLSPPPRLLRWSCSGALMLFLLVQALWLLPALDARVADVLAGGAVAPTNHHLLYVGAELSKALALLALSAEALWSLSGGNADRDRHAPASVAALSSDSAAFRIQGN